MLMESFDFYVLPANLPPQFPFRDLHNRAYSHYKNSWERILNRASRDQVLFNPDEFLRQDYIFQIMHGDSEVVCQILGTHYDLQAEITQELSYFQNFKDEAQRVLKSEKKSHLMSLEYSSTARSYSPKFMNQLNFGEIITYLGIMYARSIGVEVILGQPRRVTGTNERILNSGFRCVKSGVTKCNVTVDITLGFMDEITPCQDPRTQSLISHLWHRRRDLMGLTTDRVNYKDYFELSASADWIRKGQLKNQEIKEDSHDTATAERQF